LITRSLGFFAAAAVLACAVPVVAQNAAPALYSAPQAQQGATIYATNCAVCHGANLEGGAGPALTGSAFHQMAATEKLTPKLLLETITATMPMTAPGSLKPDQYAALTAFILSKGGYPAGSQALSPTTPQLDALNLGIDPNAPAGAAPAAAGAQRLASNGVYTLEQATRGKGYYSDNCIQCHGGELDGVEDAPALSGKSFLTKWGGKPVGAIHAFIDANMPPGNGGALGAVQEADVVAYILWKNGLPAGTTQLPADPAGLSNIILK
jgi:mono/diheme cytochrome c family protein